MNPLPENIRIFLTENIDSVSELEILRILGENPNRDWTASALAPHIQAAEERVAASLGVLQRRGLLTGRTQGKQTRWCYGPQTSELEALVERCLELYRQRPVSTINFVSARTASRSTFADNRAGGTGLKGK